MTDHDEGNWIPLGPLKIRAGERGPGVKRVPMYGLEDPYGEIEAEVDEELDDRENAEQAELEEQDRWE